MLGLLALVFLVMPILELFVIVKVAGAVGVGSTLLLIVAVSVAGAWLVKREGIGVLRRLQDQLRAGQLPTNELFDGGLIMFAGALLLAPGFLTDVLGLLLLFPPTRAVVRVALRRRYGERVIAGTILAGPRFGSPFSRVRRDEPVWDVHAWEDPPPDPPEAPELR